MIAGRQSRQVPNDTILDADGAETAVLTEPAFSGAS